MKSIYYSDDLSVVLLSSSPSSVWLEEMLSPVCSFSWPQTSRKNCRNVKIREAVASGREQRGRGGVGAVDRVPASHCDGWGEVQRQWGRKDHFAMFTFFVCFKHFVPPREVVVAQLVERSLPKPEVRGLNPVIGKIYMYYQLYWKDENKEKRGRERPNF